MEVQLTAIAMVIAAPGQTITKNTTVSLLLVVMLVGATMTITKTFTEVSNDIINLKEDVAEIKVHQAAVFEYIQRNPK